MPNLRGVNPVGRGAGGRLYAARTVGRSGAGFEREHSGATKRQGAGWSNTTRGTLRGGEIAQMRTGAGRDW